VRTDTSFLAKFIRVKDGNVDKALECMKKCYSSLNRNRSIVFGDKPQHFSKVFDSGMILPLKNHFSGVKVIVQRWGYWEPNNFDTRSCIKSIGFVVENCLEIPLTQKHGIAIITDLKGIGLRQTLKTDIMELYRGMDNLLVSLSISNSLLRFY